MFDPDELLSLFGGHLRRFHAHGGVVRGARALELGPGNSLGQAALLWILGAREVTALDVRRYASPESSPGLYRALLDRTDRWLRQLPAELRSPEFLASPEEQAERARLLFADGDDFPALSSTFRYEMLDGERWPVDASAVDLCYSISVLEHVRDLRAAYGEMARVLSPDGLCSHLIDLRDHHHPDPVDFLRYGDTLWEWMQGRSAGFTNRMRASDHLRLVDANDLKVRELERGCIGSAPAAGDLATRFLGYDPEDLRTTTLILVLGKTG